MQQRPHGQVKAGSPGWQNEIDLVLRDQPLDGLHGIVHIAMIIIFDHLDRHSLANALEHDTAFGIHLLDPEVVVRKDGDARAWRVRPAQRNRIADLDRIRRLTVCGDAARDHPRKSHYDRRPSHCHDLLHREGLSQRTPPDWGTPSVLMVWHGRILPA
jgi:hypothetical protein